MLIRGRPEILVNQLAPSCGWKRIHALAHHFPPTKDSALGAWDGRSMVIFPGRGTSRFRDLKFQGNLQIYLCSCLYIPTGSWNMVQVGSSQQPLHKIDSRSPGLCWPLKFRAGIEVEWPSEQAIARPSLIADPLLPAEHVATMAVQAPAALNALATGAATGWPFATVAWHQKGGGHGWNIKEASKEASKQRP